MDLVQPSSVQKPRKGPEKAPKNGRKKAQKLTLCALAHLYLQVKTACNFIPAAAQFIAGVFVRVPGINSLWLMIRMVVPPLLLIRMEMLKALPCPVKHLVADCNLGSVGSHQMLGATEPHRIRFFG